MPKQPKLIDVENARSLTPGKDDAFLLLYRQAVSLALKDEKKTDRAEGKSSEKPEKTL